MTEHHFTVKTGWKGGVDGEGELRGDSLRSRFSIPAALAGPGRGTNPEELIVAASASCYAITLSVVLQQRQLEPTAFEMASTATFQFERGLRLLRIEHRPCVAVPAHASGAQREAMVEALRLAEQRCMVSAAIRGHVEVCVTPSIVESSRTEHAVSERTTAARGGHIDANARLRGSDGIDGARSLLRLMDEHEIDRAVVAGGGYITPERLATHAEFGGSCDVDVDHNVLLDQCAIEPRRLLPVFVANPRRGAEPYGGSDDRFCALKLAPVLHGVPLLDDNVLKLVEIATARRHPVYLHCLHRDGFRVSDLVTLAVRFADTRFVLEHAGVGNCDFRALELIAPIANIWFESSGGFTSVIKAACERLGIERVLFGSEYPLQAPHAELEKMRCLGLDEHGLARVLGRNAGALLGLEDTHERV